MLGWLFKRQDAGGVDIWNAVNKISNYLNDIGKSGH